MRDIPKAFALAGLVTFVVGIAGSLALSGNVDLRDWSFTHWAFNYDHGVVKRSLVGEVVSHLIAPDQLRGTLDYLSIVIAALLGAALLYFFWRPWFAHRSPGAFLFGVLASTHFATLQHFFYDLGRFDQLGLLLALASFACIEKLPRAAAALAVLVACALGLFIHEAFLLLSMPLVFAYWLARDPGSRVIAPAHVAVGLALLAVMAFIVTRGGPAIPTADYLNELRATHGAWVNAGSLKVLYGGAGAESPRAIALLLDGNRLFQQMLLVGALLPTIWLSWRIHRTPVAAGAHGDEKSRFIPLMLLAAGSPFALYAIGIDYARWWSLATTNLALACALGMSMSTQWRSRVELALGGSPVAVGLALLASLACGPLGVASAAFPRLQPYVDATIDALLHWARS